MQELQRCPNNGKNEFRYQMIHLWWLSFMLQHKNAISVYVNDWGFGTSAIGSGVVVCLL